MLLKQRIINELKNTGAPNIDKMLQLMEKHGYFECRSHSHNNWTGGAAQHMWAVYLMAKAMRDKRLSEPNIAKFATDRKLAIVCLLHDLCDMSITVKKDNGQDVSDKHGQKSYWIMRNLKVGTEAEQLAVLKHMHEDAKCNSKNPLTIAEYDALHSLVAKADHNASGTAWNSTRFKQGKTQHKGVVTEDMSYLRAVAMDRSVQSGNYHRYMDQNYDLREFRNYNRDLIQWNYDKDVIQMLNDNSLKINLDENLDVISATHDYVQKKRKRLCLVVGIDSEIPQDKDTRLRRARIDEQDILICSNLLNCFYYNQPCKEKGRRHRFEFTMDPEIKNHYKQLPKQEGGIYLPGVKMIRDGASRGFAFVKPWDVDILLVPGKRFPMFAVKANCINNQ